MAGFCLKRARCRSRAAISCERRRFSTFWARTHFDISCCVKSSLGRTDHSRSTRWCSVTKTAADDVVAETARKAIREFGVLFDQFQFSRALETAWGLVAAVDRYI